MGIAGLLCVLFLPKWIAIVSFLFLSVSELRRPALIGRARRPLADRGQDARGHAAFLVLRR